MLSVSYSEVERDLKACCDRAVEAGETLRVTLGGEKDVVILSFDKYARMTKAARNADYLAMIDRGIEQLASGRGQPHDLIEVEEDE